MDVTTRCEESKDSSFLLDVGRLILFFSNFLPASSFVEWVSDLTRASSFDWRQIFP